MDYRVDDSVSEHWDFIISSFVTSILAYTEFHKMPEVYDLEFNSKRGLLDIRYKGGDKITDALAYMARNTSGSICDGCGALATGFHFGRPKCGDCS